MKINVIKKSKNEMEFEIDNPTLAEVMRVYLNENGADFAAWKRVHPSKPAVMHMKAEKLSKVVSDSVIALHKDCDKLLDIVKK